MNFLDDYQVIHYGDEVDIDCILTDYFLHRSDSCELDKIFSLLSLISVCFIKIGQDFYHFRENVELIPLPPLPHIPELH